MSIELNLPKTKGLFITGTDTGVGKTLIAGVIARILTQQQKTVGVFKPVASGCARTREGLVSEDTEFLAFCAESQFPLETITPVTFETPAAPFVCEQKENRRIDFARIETAYKYIVENSDCVLVEGIGGVRVPITKDFDVIELAKAFGLDVVVVARANLGTINHTLLTIEALRAAGLSLAGVVLNGYDETKADYAQMTNPAVIAEIGRVKILSIAPYDQAADVATGSLGDYLTEALSEFDWKSLIK